MKQLWMFAIAVLCFFGLVPLGEASEQSSSSEEEQVVSDLQEKPNIIVIVADQFRYDALGFVNSDVQTPNLDRLAAEGVSFDNSYATSPVCSANRVVLMTGRFPHQGGNKLIVGEPTIADIFKGEGYSTYHIGKWHSTPDSLIKSSGYVPPVIRPGWDYFEGHERFHHYWDWYHFVGNNNAPQYYWGYVPNGETKTAVQKIAASSEPFLLWLSFGAPHNAPLTGYNPPSAFDFYDPASITVPPNVPAALVSSAQQSLAKYYGLVSSIDFNVGVILDTLDQLGIADNTIVVFTSDHGDMHRSQGVSGSLKKRRPYREAVRTPLIVRYPKKIKPLQRSTSLVASIDFLPMILSLAGVQMPDTIQGQKQGHTPVLPIQDTLRYESVYLEITDTASKNACPNESWRGVVVKKGNQAWKYALCSSGQGWLYRLDTDPYELINLFQNPSYVQIQNELHRIASTQALQTGDTFFQ